MLNQYIRYIPIIEYITTHKLTNAEICEIGSGSYGIGKFQPDLEFTGVDVTFDDYSTASKPGVITHPQHMRPVIGSSTALPFPDKSFDLVFSTDMMEHLTIEQRKQGLAEMIRVSRTHVIFGMPAGMPARRCDQRTKTSYNWMGKKVPGWLQEHLTVPMVEETFFDQILQDQGISFQKRQHENAQFHLLLNIIEAIPYLDRMLAKLSTRQPAWLQSLFKKVSGGDCYRLYYTINLTTDKYQ